MARTCCPNYLGAEVGGSSEPRSLKLQWALITLLHSNLDNRAGPYLNNNNTIIIMINFQKCWKNFKNMQYFSHIICGIYWLFVMGPPLVHAADLFTLSCFALCPRRLASVDFITWCPHPLVSGWAWPMEGTGRRFEGGKRYNPWYFLLPVKALVGCILPWHQFLVDILPWHQFLVDILPWHQFLQCRSFSMASDLTGLW